jgi:heterodisulfide reductase subunit C
MGMASENVPDLAWKHILLDRVGETLNLCFQCGTCTSSCPSGRLTAFRTRQIIRKAQFGLKDSILPSDDLWHCTTCYTCYERCPRGVEIVEIMMALRNMAVNQGFMAKEHKALVKSLHSSGHIIPVSDKIKQMRKAVGLKELPDTVLVDAEAQKQVQFIMEQTGLMRLLRGD